MSDFKRTWGADPYNTADAMTQIMAPAKSVRKMVFRRNRDRTSTVNVNVGRDRPDYEQERKDFNMRNSSDHAVYAGGILAIMTIVLALVAAMIVMIFR
jgi:hypothetical protein